MKTMCQKCNKEVKDFTFYPHLRENFFKPNVDLSTVPQDILKELPQPHLHIYYNCECGHINYGEDLPLLTEDEMLYYKKNGRKIRKERTVKYWTEWLEKNRKK